MALSGDISAGEPPPGRSRLENRHPGDRLEPGRVRPTSTSCFETRAVSTAGDTYQFVEIGGKRYSHLIDPKTGLGITRRISVTVIAPTGLESDGLDSAAAILGPERG